MPLGYGHGSARDAFLVGQHRSLEADLIGQYARRADEVRDAVLMGSNDQMSELAGRYREAGADQLNIAIRATRDWQRADRRRDLDQLSELAAVLAVGGVRSRG